MHVDHANRLGGGRFWDAGDAIAAQVFARRPPRVPGVVAGANITITQDGFGYVIAASTGAAGDADQFVLPGRVFDRHWPAVPEVRAGANVTVTRDALGYSVAWSAENDQHVLSTRALTPHPPRIPDIRAGANVTVTSDAQGVVIAGPTVPAVDDASVIGAQRAHLPHLPAIPDVRAGANVTVTRDAQGYQIASTGGGTAVDDANALGAQRAFGPHAGMVWDIRGGLRWVDQEAITAASYPLAAGSPCNALAGVPIAGSDKVFWRGTRCRRVASSPGLNEYTISGAIITPGFTVQSADHFYADYRRL